MKCILKFVIVFATLLTISCSKDEENIVDDLKDETVKFYANNPNTDGLLAEVKISDKNATAFFYGTSNDSSEPSDINSISFVPNNTDTITNIILDNNKRPSIVTFNKKNGQKINTIVKYEYLTNDTISYSIYKYDWITHKDSLQFQAKTKDTYSIKTYGARGLFTIDANFRSTAVTLVSSLAVAAVVCGTIAVLGPAALAWAIANPALALGGLTFAAGIIANASPNQQIQTTINHNAPTSPTSGIIPNPTGTPSDPTNDYALIKSKLLGKWKLVDYIENGVSISVPNQCISDNIITFSDTGITFNEGPMKCYLQTPQSTSINFNLIYDYTFNGSRTYKLTSFTGLTGTGGSTGYLPITMSFSLYWRDFGSNGGQDYLGLQEWGSLSNYFKFIKVP